MKLSRRIISFVLVAVLLIGTMSITASAAGTIMYGIGFTTGSNLRLRSAASTSSKVVDVAPKGEVVVVVAKEGDWYKVIYNLQEGYMHSDYVSVLTKENAELGYGKVTGNNVNLRSGAGTSYKAVTQADKGDKVYIVGLNSGWYKVIFDGKICYIRSDFVELTEIPYENQDSNNSPIFYRGGKSTGVALSASALNGSTGSSSSGSSSSGGSSSGSGSSSDSGSSSGSTGTSDIGAQIVAKAKQYLGTPYKYGGASPSTGFDCSGLVYYVLKQLGYSPYRSSSAQYAMGTYVAKSDLQPGDLVFFANTYKAGISHVGIYVGDGKFIHSPNSGSVVSYADLNSSYYTSHYYGARRIG